MNNDKAEILTEAEVARYMTFPYLLEGGTGERALATIRQMAGLLERFANLYPYHPEFVSNELCCERCKAKLDAHRLLARYKGERQ